MDASVIAAIAAALLGGGGVAAYLRLGPERTATVVGYQRKIIKDMDKRHRELGKENARLRRRLKRLEARVSELELEQDDPPPYLG